MRIAHWSAPLWLALACLSGAAGAAPPAPEYFERYALVPGSPQLDLGSQPLGYPSGVISAVMRHDRVLRAALAAAGHPLAIHPFRRGADMLELLGSDRLQAGLLGDMPTILSASLGHVWVVGLVKQSNTAVVAAGAAQVRGLAGKRIGYVPASSAHYVLLQGLASAGMGERDVALVALAADLMPGALARGEIDAFAAWEPAPALALAGNARNQIVFRGLSTDYFVIGRAFEQRAPEAARALVAGFARAVEWLRGPQRNIEKAARWTRADGAAFSSEAAAATPAQIVAIMRRDLLNVPSAPAMPAELSDPATLKNEFDFLRQVGKLPAEARWSQVAAAFGYDGLARVLSEPRRYALRVFDYDE